MGLMSNDDPKLTIQFTNVFKHQVRDLAKRYRRIKLDIQHLTSFRSASEWRLGWRSDSKYWLYSI